MKLFVLEWNRSARGEDGAAAPTLFAASGALIAHDGPLHVVGDIQLHAREELRRRLASAGVSADAGTGDGSLILAAWRAWGPTCVDRIIGDFAFALWDDGRREVFCARDQLGVRPLYYADVRGAFVCSNAIAAIRQHAQVSSQVHTPAIVSFLECGWNTDLGTTTFSDIRRLPPGHTMNVRTDAAPAPHRYWQFPVPEPLVYSSDTDYIEHYRQVLSDAGRDRTGDGPVGLMLSGGLDSTSLAATLRRTAPAQLVTAYTTDVGAIVPNDDVRLARLVASRLGMPHDVSADIPQALEHLTDSTFHPPEP
ncbi:MAG: asparagine synthase-related protein, partial [Gemmatimonadota bacterium]|nr:asparagine synthase-related protein [Gemmatimonadota bacterium]